MFWYKITFTDKTTTMVQATSPRQAWERCEKSSLKELLYIKWVR